MGSLDFFILALLKRIPSLTETEVDRLADWWSSECRPSESLAAFLVRQHVLTPAAATILELVEKRSLPLEDIRHLFCPQGLDFLLSRLREPRPIPTVPVSQPASLQEPSVPARPMEGAVLGKCLLTDCIGEGASGLVFRAVHRTLNIPVAVKVLQSELLHRDPSVARQFRAEAHLLAQLNHPNVVRVLDFEEDHVFPYLVLEYVEGPNLEELIKHCGRVPFPQAFGITAQVAWGLDAAWGLGVVHRDVKPGNILLTRDGVAKLSDLGLALVLDDRPTVNAEEPILAKPRMGTAAYMSPEQVTGSCPLDHRSDIYSLGVTLYHAVTGVLPFMGRTLREAMLKHVTEEPIPPHEQAPNLVPVVSEVILRMMAKDPAARFQSYSDLVESLEAVTLQLQPAGARPSTWRSLLHLKALPASDPRD